MADEPPLAYKLIIDRSAILKRRIGSWSILYTGPPIRASSSVISKMVYVQKFILSQNLSGSDMYGNAAVSHIQPSILFPTNKQTAFEPAPLKGMGARLSDNDISNFDDFKRLKDF